MSKIEEHPEFRKIICCFGLGLSTFVIGVSAWSYPIALTYG